MTRSQRTRHLLMWVAITPITGFALAAAIAFRPDHPTPEQIGGWPAAPAPQPTPQSGNAPPPGAAAGDDRTENAPRLRAPGAPDPATSAHERRGAA